MGIFPSEDELEKIENKKEQVKNELDAILSDKNCTPEQLMDMKKAIRKNSKIIKLLNSC